MKDVIIHCKQYNEWDEAIQKIILEKHGDIEVAWEGWSDFIIEDWERRLTEMGFPDSDISYRGFWSQGDGASFTCTSVEIETWIKYNKLTQFYPILRRMRESKLYISAYIDRHNSNSYVHERSIYVDVDWGWLGNGNPSPKLGEVIIALQDALELNAIKLNKQIYRDLEKEYDYRVSDECVAECLIDNEYEFDEEGKIW